MSTNPVAPLIGDIYGPLYFGTLLSVGLYGATCMQTFFYYVHYPNDSLRLKCFVAALWAFDTIYEALIISGVYKYIMAGLMNPMAIMNEIPELAILTAAMVSMPTQGFFVYRIYRFSGKNIIPPILWAIQVIYQYVAAIIYVAKSFYWVDGKLHVVGLSVLSDRFFMNVTISCLALAAGVDVLIAIAMTFLLLQKRNSVGFARSSHILQRLTLFAVNTGIWTATFNVLAVILMRALPATNLLYLVFAIPLASIYCNTLLANLNARAYIQGGDARTHDHNAHLMMMMSAPVSSHTRPEIQSEDTGFMSSKHLNIRKTTEVVTLMDVDLPTPEKV